MKSKKTARSPNLDFYIYEKLKSGYRPVQLLKIDGIYKSKLYYHLDSIERLGLISKVSYGVWEVIENVSEKNFEKLKKQVKKKKSKKMSLGTIDKPKCDLHALQIKIPILEGKIKDQSWEIKEKLKNWTPKYTTLPELGGLRIKNNNNKSITIWTFHREVQNTDEVRKLAQAIPQYLASYFLHKHQVKLDLINLETKNLDYATEDKQAESKRGKGDKFTLNLNKKCEKLFKNDNRDAFCWIDGTPYKFSAETNDLEWKDAYLRMPFGIRDILHNLPLLEQYNQNLQKYNKNIELHTKVQEEQLKTQKEIQRLLEKLNISL